MTSKSATGVCDSIVTMRVPDSRSDGQFLLRRQERALADDVGLVVEQPVDRLEAEVRHPDEIGVGENQGDPQPVGVRLAHVTNFRERISCASSRWCRDFISDSRGSSSCRFAGGARGSPGYLYCISPAPVRGSICPVRPYPSFRRRKAGTSRSRFRSNSPGEPSVSPPAGCRRHSDRRRSAGAAAAGMSSAGRRRIVGARMAARGCTIDGAVLASARVGRHVDRRLHRRVRRRRSIGPDVVEAGGDHGDLHLVGQRRSTTAPKMMLASSCADSWMIVSASLTSSSDMSGPPVTLMITPRAPLHRGVLEQRARDGAVGGVDRARCGLRPSPCPSSPRPCPT